MARKKAYWRGKRALRVLPMFFGPTSMARYKKKNGKSICDARSHIVSCRIEHGDNTNQKKCVKYFVDFDKVKVMRKPVSKVDLLRTKRNPMPMFFSRCRRGPDCLNGSFLNDTYITTWSCQSPSCDRRSGTCYFEQKVIGRSIKLFLTLETQSPWRSHDMRSTKKTIRPLVSQVENGDYQTVYSPKISQCTFCYLWFISRCNEFTFDSGRLFSLLPLSRECRNKCHAAALIYAIQFRRKFNYDFWQYCEKEDRQKTMFLAESKPMSLFSNVPSKEAVQAYLIAIDDHSCFDQENRIIGAITLRWRMNSNVPASWALQWVYIHPNFQGKGILGKIWPTLRFIHDEFSVEKPHSQAMEKFLKKQT